MAERTDTPGASIAGGTKRSGDQDGNKPKRPKSQGSGAAPLDEQSSFLEIGSVIKKKKDSIPTIDQLKLMEKYIDDEKEPFVESLRQTFNSCAHPPKRDTHPDPEDLDTMITHHKAAFSGRRDHLKKVEDWLEPDQVTIQKENNREIAGHLRAYLVPAKRRARTHALAFVKKQLSTLFKLPAAEREPVKKKLEDLADFVRVTEADTVKRRKGGRKQATTKTPSRTPSKKDIKALASDEEHLRLKELLETYGGPIDEPDLEPYQALLRLHKIYKTNNAHLKELESMQKEVKEEKQHIISSLIKYIKKNIADRKRYMKLRPDDGAIREKEQEEKAGKLSEEERKELAELKEWLRSLGAVYALEDTKKALEDIKNALEDLRRLYAAWEKENDDFGAMVDVVTEAHQITSFLRPLCRQYKIDHPDIAKDIEAIEEEVDKMKPLTS